MRNIIDGQVSEKDLEGQFNLEKEINNKIRLLSEFGFYGENRQSIISDLKKCTNQQQLDNVMRKAFRMYL